MITGQDEVRHRLRRQSAIEEAVGLGTAIHGEIAGQQQRPVAGERGTQVMQHVTQACCARIHTIETRVGAGVNDECRSVAPDASRRALSYAGVASLECKPAHNLQLIIDYSWLIGLPLMAHHHG